MRDISWHWWIHDGPIPNHVYSCIDMMCNFLRKWDYSDMCKDYIDMMASYNTPGWSDKCTKKKYCKSAIFLDMFLQPNKQFSTTWDVWICVLICVNQNVHNCVHVPTLRTLENRGMSVDHRSASYHQTIFDHDKLYPLVATLRHHLSTTAQY